MLVERRLTLRCTGFIAISMGMVINFSTSSALLPGHCVMILISVLVTSGNASIGIFLKVMIPAITKISVQNKTKYLFLSENPIIPFNKLIINSYLRFYH